MPAKTDSQGLRRQLDNLREEKSTTNGVADEAATSSWRLSAPPLATTYAPTPAGESGAGPAFLRGMAGARPGPGAGAVAGAVPRVTAATVTSSAASAAVFTTAAAPAAAASFATTATAHPEGATEVDIPAAGAAAAAAVAAAAASPSGKVSTLDAEGTAPTTNDKGPVGRLGGEERNAATVAGAGVVDSARVLSGSTVAPPLGGDGVTIATGGSGVAVPVADGGSCIAADAVIARAGPRPVEGGGAATAEAVVVVPGGDGAAAVAASGSGVALAAGGSGSGIAADAVTARADGRHVEAGDREGVASSTALLAVKEQVPGTVGLRAAQYCAVGIRAVCLRTVDLRTRCTQA